MAHGHDIETHKRCPRCDTVKSRVEFGKNRSAKDGLQSYCKPCASAATLSSRAKNPERFAAYQKNYLIEHADTRRETVRRWFERNPEYRSEWEAAHPGNAVERTMRWQAKNMPRVLAANATYRASVAAQTIKLTSEQKEEIVLIYSERDRLTRETGVLHAVDHEVPLNGENVCGLHVPWNLRPLPSRENCSKGNKLLAEFA